MSKYIALVLLVINIFIITQLFVFEYRDIYGNIEFQEDNTYTRVNKIGRIFLPRDNIWWSFDFNIVVMLISQALTIVLLLTSLGKSLFENLKNIKPGRMLINSSIFIFILLFFYYSHVFKSQWAIYYGTDSFTLLVRYIAFMVISILFLLINKSFIILHHNKKMYVWLFLAILFIAIGYQIDNYSSALQHMGDIHHDYLFIALYANVQSESFQHLWTPGYTLFRFLNTLFVIIGALIITMFSSLKHKLHS